MLCYIYSFDFLLLSKVAKNNVNIVKKEEKKLLYITAALIIHIKKREEEFEFPINI